MANAFLGGLGSIAQHPGQRQSFERLAAQRGIRVESDYASLGYRLHDPKSGRSRMIDVGQVERADPHIILDHFQRECYEYNQRGLAQQQAGLENTYYGLTATQARQMMNRDQYADWKRSMLENGAMVNNPHYGWKEPSTYKPTPLLKGIRAVLQAETDKWLKGVRVPA